MIGTIVAAGISMPFALGQTTVGPGEVRSVTSSNSASYILNGGTLAPTDVELAGEIELQSSSIILRPQNRLIPDRLGNLFEEFTGPTTLSGQISGNGDIEIGNESRNRFFVSGDSNYSGQTYITTGNIFSTTANAFGSTVAGITIQGGSLTVLAPTDERFRIEGGTLTFNAGDFIPSDPITIAGGTVFLPQRNDYAVPIITDGPDGTIRFGSSDVASWSGGSSGTGNLKIEGRVSVDAPLTHNGDLIINGPTLNAINTYTGKTIIAVPGTYVIDRADVFGISTTPIEIINNGRTIVNVVPNGDRGFAIKQGTLDVQVSDSPINGDMFLGDGFAATILGIGVFNGRLELSGEENTRAAIRGGTFNGGISGAARQLTLGGNDPVILNSNNDYQSITLSSGEQPVEVNVSRALGDPEQGTRVSFNQFNFNAATDEPIVVTSRGKVNLNAQQDRFPRFADLDSTELGRRHTVEVNVPSAYTESVDVVEGTLQINANTSLGNLAVRKNGAVRIAKGRTLDIGSQELMFEEGLIDGRIRGSGTLRKTTTARGEIPHLPGFDGDIVVERGALEVFSGDALGTTVGATYVAEKDAVLRVNADGSKAPVVIQDDIVLTNATGIDHTGGLFVSRFGSGGTPTVQINGRLELGDLGSIIGSPSSSSTADNVNLKLIGPVSGGSLTTWGRRLRIKLLNGDNSYSGLTNIRQSTIELSGNGRLASTSRIILNEGPESFDGTLLLNNSEQSLPDRVADSIPIDFRGGKLLATGGTTESLGQVNFIEGDSRVELSSSTLSSQLQVAALTRQVGATAQLRAGNNGQLNVVEPLSLSGGILPWLVVRDSFSPSNYDSFGIVVDGRVRGMSANAFVSGFAAANEIDNVVVQQSDLSLTIDTTVNSLVFGISHSPVDLGGNQLRVSSGGIILGNGGRVENGTLVPGETNELIFYGRGAVSANITDSESGAVSVTYADGSTGLNLSGNNTYTGTTYVNAGAAYLANASALPDNGDLVIVGGDLQIGYVATAPKHLGQVRITGGGALTQSFTGQGGQGIFSFDQIVLEEGNLIPGQLVGSGGIVKRTIGPASISADQRSTYDGQVIVEEGRLFSRGLPLANYVVRGGSLYLPTGGNQISLEGGTLYVTNELTGNILVSSKSTISTEDASSFRFTPILSGELTGGGDLMLTSELRFQKIRHEVALSNNSPNYTGDVTIDSVLVDAQQQQSLGTGSITILPGGKLRFGGRGISSELPSFDLSNEIHLRGGELFGVDNDRQPRQLLGDLRVSDQSLIGEMNVLGTTYLEDGARLTTFREGVLRFLGDIKIGGKAELEYGLQQIVTNSAGTNGGVVQLLGTISSDADDAVLNFLDRGLDEIVLDASYQIAAGQTLQLLKDGQPIELKVDGSQNRITGGGTLLNPVEFENGATISPGSSPGVLSLGSSMTLGDDSVYEWEINDVLGEAGQSVGWDLLQVGDELIFDATEQNPFILKVIGLDETGEEGIVDNFDPSQNYEWLIASANSITGFDPAIVQIDTSSFISNNPLPDQSRLSLRFGGGNLFLVHQVPEPASWILISLGLMSIASRRRD